MSAIEPRDDGVRVLRDVCYGEARVAMASGPRYRPLLVDIYQPPPRFQNLRPAVVFVFGGAFHRGSKEGDVVEEDGHRNTPLSAYARRLAADGWVCACIDYRLTPEDPDPGVTPVLLRPLLVSRARIDHVRGIMGLPPSTPEMVVAAIEAAIDDTATAVRWLRASAADHAVDPSRIVLAGFSAGGMAALAATYAVEVGVAGVVSLSGAMGPAEMRAYVRDGRQPPALLVCGENDLPGMRAVNEMLDRHMNATGVAHRLQVVAGGTHFYEGSEPVRDASSGAVSTVEGAIRTFLARVAAP